MQGASEPVAEIVHLRGRSGRTSPGPTRDAWRASHLAFYRKHLPRWAGLLEWYLRAPDLRDMSHLKYHFPL